jgi:hypothetical protein
MTSSNLQAAKLPTKSQKRKLVRLLASYINKDGAPVSTQQKAYNAWMSYLEDLEKAYPYANFRSEETVASLTGAAKALAKKKIFRGAGATF